jgi:hypothetical protein
MFKWILIILVIFIATWSFGRSNFPVSVTKSKFGLVVDDVLFPLIKRADRLKGLEMKYKSSIIKLDGQKFNEIIASINSANKTAVVYFFDPKDFSTRFLLRGINQLSLDFKNTGTLFFIVAFSDDKDEYSAILNSFESIGFRPLLVDSSMFKVAEYAFIKNDIRISDLPVIIFKSESRSYESITPDIDTKERLLYLINNKL